MILLNATGDVTIGWDESQNSEMKDMIQRKLVEGCSFFIIEKKCFGLFSKKLKIRSVHDIKGNEITIADESLSELFKDGKLSAGKTPHMSYDTAGYSTDPDEILNNDTLVVNKIAAG
jgi:hypothetical protein